MISSKDDGGIIGLVSKSDGELVDLNEAVTTTSAEEALVCHSDDGIKLVFSSKIDPLSGSLTWYQNENDDLIMQRTIGMSQMKSMLSDTDRNTVYESAIKICLENYIKVNNTLPSVLDIGTGTGLLAMLCTRHNANSVTGCEMFETMADIAQDVITKNNLQDKIMIIPQKSTDIELEGDDKADILVSELLDSALLGESCIFSHGDAITRLLKSDECNTVPLSQRIMPYDADVYATLVESNDIKNMHDVSQFSKLYKMNPWRDDDAKDCSGGWSLVPVHWKESLEARNARYLSSSKQILNVNFTKGYSEDLDETTGCPFGSGCYETDIVVEQDGSLDGVLLWWKLKLLSPELDPERILTYSTEPGVQNWQDHWLQVVYPLPKSFDCQQGDHFRIKASHDTIRISIDVNKVVEVNNDNRKRAKVDVMKQMVPCSVEGTDTVQCSCGWHFLCGPERLLMLNDSLRASTYDKAINVLISKFCKIQNETSIILDTGDGSLLSILAGNALKRIYTDNDKIKIVSKESQQFSRIFHDQLIESNELENIMILWDGDNFDDVVNVIYDEIDIENSSTAPTSQIIYALMSECFQYQLTALPVWQALSFYYERISLQSLLSDNAIIMPAKGYIMAAAIELESLYISHGNAEIVSGFDHTPLDERQSNWHQNLFPFNLAKYGKIFLTKPMMVAELDYVIPTVSINNKATEILENGRCDCVAIWLDYNLIDDIMLMNGKDFELHYKCNLKFFPKPIDVTQTSTLHSSVIFNDGDSDFIFDFNIM